MQIKEWAMQAKQVLNLLRIYETWIWKIDNYSGRS